ncbi:MAG: carbohydrate ABC transporter permease, partial [Elusimicrobiota bacterium]
MLNGVKHPAVKHLKTLNKILSYVLLSIVGIVMIAPFIWMLSTSLKEPGAVFTYPPKFIPDPLRWKNYADAWNAVPFGRFFVNSIIVSVCVTLGQVFTSSLAAYAFARLKFFGKDKIFLSYLATMMIPFPVTMIPVFILITKLRLIDSLYALIIPGIFTAYGTFMLRQFFLSIPRELEEAAIIDGAGRWKIYWNIVLPLSKPALATLATFTFMGTW